MFRLGTAVCPNGTTLDVTPTQLLPHPPRFVVAVAGVLRSESYGRGLRLTFRTVRPSLIMIVKAGCDRVEDLEAVGELRGE